MRLKNIVILLPVGTLNRAVQPINQLNDFRDFHPVTQERARQGGGNVKTIDTGSYSSDIFQKLFRLKERFTSKDEHVPDAGVDCRLDHLADVCRTKTTNTLAINTERTTIIARLGETHVDGIRDPIAEITWFE